MTPDTILLAVNGTLMQGLELSPNMTAAGAEFVREATTEPTYRLWSIDDAHPAMMRVGEGGTGDRIRSLGCSSRRASCNFAEGATGFKYWQGETLRWKRSPGGNRRDHLV